MGKILDLFSQSLSLAAEGVKESVKVASDKFNDVREAIKADAMAAEEECCVGGTLYVEDEIDCIGDDMEGCESGEAVCDEEEKKDDTIKSLLGTMHLAHKQIKQFMEELNISTIKCSTVPEGSILEL